jgi:WD40 repeat protein
VLFEFDVGGQEVRSAELSPDGRSLLTISSDGTASIWPALLRKTDLANSVLEAVGGCLSQSERRALGIPVDRPAWCAPEAGDQLGGLTSGE